MCNYMIKEYRIYGNVSPLVLASHDPMLPGYEIKCAFRYGGHYEQSARDGSPAYVIDLYQRKALVTGRAMASAKLDFPDADELVEVEGIVIRQGDDLAIWVRKLVPLPLLCPHQCIFDMAIPHWVVDHAVVDRACALWATLPEQDRLFINSVFHKPRVLRGFLAAPGSCNDHHAFDGGCLEHSVEAAELAAHVAATKTNLDKDLLVTSALIHDAGKCLEYIKTRTGRWRMSRYGRRVGHKVSGIQLATVAMLRCPEMSAARKEDLIHVLGASYAPRWVGLRAPSSPEAALLAALDRVSAESGIQRSV